MEERARRIVETAIELAEKGGFEAVRLRDVAAHSGVALGTLYRHFRSKEELLLGALADQIAQLERLLESMPTLGPTPLQRVTTLFTMATRAMCLRPMLARAVIAFIYGAFWPSPEVHAEAAANLIFRFKSFGHKSRNMCAKN